VNQNLREHGKIVIGIVQATLLGLLALVGIRAVRAVRRLGGRHDGTFRVHQQGHGEERTS
jgi:hypothetical protein